MCEIYNKIDELCKSKQITVSQMCREIGISRSSLSELKAGRSRSLTTKNVLAIASYFNVPTDFLNGVGVFSNWRDIMKHLDDVFWQLRNDLPPNLYWHEDDDKYLYPYLDSSFYYGNDYSVFTNWLFEAVTAVEISPLIDNEDYSEVNIVYKTSFIKLMDAARKEREEAPLIIKSVSVRDALNDFINRHEFDTADEYIEELIGVCRKLNFSSKRQLMGKAYELLDKQNNPQTDAEITPPDIDLAAPVMDRRVKK